MNWNTGVFMMASLCITGSTLAAPGVRYTNGQCSPGPNPLCTTVTMTQRVGGWPDTPPRPLARVPRHPATAAWHRGRLRPLASMRAGALGPRPPCAPMPPRHPHIVFAFTAAHQRHRHKAPLRAASSAALRANESGQSFQLVSALGAQPAGLPIAPPPRAAVAPDAHSQAHDAAGEDVWAAPVENRQRVPPPVDPRRAARRRSQCLVEEFGRPRTPKLFAQ